jgi:PAS domain S-box-containing protein
VRFTAVAVAYFIVSLLGVAFVVQPEQLSVFWPGGGLALGYLLVIDRRHWPTVLAAIFAGNAAGNLAHGHTLAVSSGFAVVNAIEPFACAGLLTLVHPGRIRLDNTRDVGWLFAVPAVVCAGTALVGAAVVAAGLGVPSYWGVWKVWWLADALGTILFAPLVLGWAAPVRSGSWRRGPVLQASFLLAALAAVVWAIFGSELRREYPLLALPYPIFLLLLFVTLRSGLRGTTVAVAVTALLAVWGTIHGAGPVSSLDLPAADRVLVTQGFAAVVALSSLILATAVQERQAREAEATALNRALTERVQEAERATVALRESERRFQAIFHSQFQFIGLMSPDGTLLEANRTALAAAGVDESAVIGKRFWDTGWWTHDAAQQDRLRGATAAAAAGERVRFEASHPTADGGLMWVDFSLTPFRDDAGRVVLLIPEGREISDRKRVEERLRESEERFDLAVRGSQDGIWDWHVPTGAVYFSPRWKGMLGYADAEVDNRFETWERLVHPDDLPRAKAALASYLEGSAESYVVEVRMWHKDGSVRWILTRGVAERDATGRPTRMAGSHTDVTDRRLKADQLAANESLLQQFVAHAPAAIAMLDTEMRYLRVSDRWATDYHLSEQALIGRSHYEVFPDCPERWLATHRRVLAGAVEACAEDPFPRADGTTEWLQWECRPWRTGAGEIGGLIMFTQVITGRKAAEEALRESEERFRSMADSAPVLIWVAGVDKKCHYFNKPWLAFTGRTAEQEAGDGWAEGVHPDDFARCVDTYVTSFDARVPFSMEYRLRRHDGQYRWLLDTGIPRFGPDGTFAGFIGSCIDVSDQRAVTEQLRLSEARFKSLAANAPVGIYETDAVGNCLFVNARWCWKAGLTPDEAAGTGWVAAIHPDDRDRVVAEWHAAAEAQTEFVSDYRFRTPAGRVTWLSGRAVGIRDEAGRVLGYIGTVMNLTARMEAEAKLRASEERYRSVVEVLAEGIVLQDARGEIIAFNDRAGKILGLSRDQLTGRTSFDPEWRAVLEDGSPFPGEEHPAIIALRTGQPVFDVLMGVERPTRERVWLSVNAVPFGDPVRQVVASFHDVTEARRLNERILGSLREKDVMLREIHHRVKNNLAVIASLFHLQSGYTTDEPVLRLLREAQHRVRSMALVHEHLYNTADLGAVNFAEYTRSLVEQLFRSYLLPDSTVRLALDIRPVTLAIDQAVPCGLLLNELVSNGLKHAFPDRGGSLTVGLGVDGEACVLRVADDGVGLPPDRLEGKPRSLGLRLIRTLARQLNGTVEFRPATPGTEVRAAFPILDKGPGANA